METQQRHMKITVAAILPVIIYNVCSFRKLMLIEAVFHVLGNVGNRDVEDGSLEHIQVWVYQSRQEG